MTSCHRQSDLLAATVVVTQVLASGLLAPACRPHEAAGAATARCARCHGGGSPNGLYADWRRSPWAAAIGGEGCGSCHVAEGLPLVCRTATAGPRSEASRPGVDLGHAAEIQLVAHRLGGDVLVEASVVNTGTGHRLPGTARHVLELAITLCDAHGKAQTSADRRCYSTERRSSCAPALAPFATAVTRSRLADPQNRAQQVVVTLYLVPTANRSRAGAPRFIRSVHLVLAAEKPRYHADRPARRRVGFIHGAGVPAGANPRAYWRISCVPSAAS